MSTAPLEATRGSRLQAVLRDRRVHIWAVLVVLLILLVVWLLTPRAFDSYQNSTFASFEEPIETEPALLPVTGPDRPVEVLWARARVTEGNPDDVTVVVCDGDHEGGNIWIGLATVDLGCRNARPAAGERIESEEVFPPTGLAVVFEPTSATPLAIKGIDVVYRDGIRLGVQRIGTNFRAPYERAR